VCALTRNTRRWTIPPFVVHCFHPVGAILIFCLLLLIFFRDAFFNGSIPLFRDGGNFFFPLWTYLTGEYRQGRLPLWNPYINLGAPLAAENSCAAFYPGMAILALPVPFKTAYLVFLLVHLGVGAWGIVRLARKCGATTAGAFLAMLSYPFSGYVLFQIYNPIFLVSAAWLPWAVDALLEIVLRTGASLKDFYVKNETHQGTKLPTQVWISFWDQVAPVTRFGVFLSLMVLGGDPQTAYHCVILACATWIIQIMRTLRNRLRGRKDPSRLTSVLGVGLFLGAAMVIAFLLAAIQIIPTAAYTSVSERELLKPSVSRLVPKTCKNSEFQNGNSMSDTALASTARKRHESLWDRVIYDFSTPAYRWIEFIWPGFGGRPLPNNTRWLAAFVAEGRWWTPSMYMGLFPFLLAVLGMQFWPARNKRLAAHPGGLCETKPPVVCLQSQSMERVRIWLSWVSVVSLLAATGWYGPAGLFEGLQACSAKHPDAVTVLPPVGGIYWMLTQVVPGYEFFRYPSKWLVIATMALSVLASLAISRIDANHIRRLTWLSMSIIVSAICLLAIASFIPRLWDYTARHAPVDPVFGAFEPKQAKLEVITGLAIVGGLAGAWLCIAHRVPQRFLPIAILLLTACDLVFQNGWLILPVRAEESPKLAGHPQPPTRFWQKWCEYPKEWVAPSTNRIQELYDWEKASSAVRWGMVTGHAPLQSYGTLVPADYYAFLAILHEYMNRHRLPTPPRETLKLLGALPTGDVNMPDDRKSSPGMARDSFCENHYCFLSHDWVNLTTQELSQSDTWTLTESVFFPLGRPRSLSDPVVVETSDADWQRFLGQTGRKNEESTATTVKERCHLESFRAGDVVIGVCLRKPGIVVVREQFMPGWHVTVTSQDRTMTWSTSPLRINRIMMGVALPPGEWQITWTYRDPGLKLGTVLSGVAWFGLAFLAIGRRISLACRQRCAVG